MPAEAEKTDLSREGCKGESSALRHRPLASHEPQPRRNISPQYGRKNRKGGKVEAESSSSSCPLPTTTASLSPLSESQFSVYTTGSGVLRASPKRESLCGGISKLNETISLNETMKTASIVDYPIAGDAPLAVGCSVPQVVVPHRGGGRQPPAGPATTEDDCMEGCGGVAISRRLLDTFEQVAASPIDGEEGDDGDTTKTRTEELTGAKGLSLGTRNEATPSQLSKKKVNNVLGGEKQSTGCWVAAAKRALGSCTGAGSVQERERTLTPTDKTVSAVSGNKAVAPTAPKPGKEKTQSEDISSTMISPTCVSDIEQRPRGATQKNGAESVESSAYVVDTGLPKVGAGLTAPTSVSATEGSERDNDGESDNITNREESRPPSSASATSVDTVGSASTDDTATLAPLPLRGMPGAPVAAGETVMSAKHPSAGASAPSSSSCVLVEAAKNSSEGASSVVRMHPSMSRLGDFALHDSLRLHLSQPLVNRVSFYGVIHDINKEAASMAAEDHSAFHKLTVEGGTAVGTSCTEGGMSMSDAALIDEEEWLLSVIAGRSEEETARVGENAGTDASFAYAIGDSKDDVHPSEVAEAKQRREHEEREKEREREYQNGDKPNPIGEINGSSRTRLWKPSRSWWEARSGKNPWVDPENHVKRWRYLWPLIHYHKFLAKCIKKLKRHGVSDFLGPDSSPVISFLRHEIIAVSDHLAACSKFSSEEWLEALQHFIGWNDTSPEAQECLSILVARQKLRSFADPSSDSRLASPLIRKVMENSSNHGERKAERPEKPPRGGRKGDRYMQWQPQVGPVGYGLVGYPHHAMPHNYYYYPHMHPHPHQGYNPMQPKHSRRNGRGGNRGANRGRQYNKFQFAPLGSRATGGTPPLPFHAGGYNEYSNHYHRNHYHNPHHVTPIAVMGPQGSPHQDPYYSGQGHQSYGDGTPVYAAGGPGGPPQVPHYGAMPPLHPSHYQHQQDSDGEHRVHSEPREAYQQDGHHPMGQGGAGAEATSETSFTQGSVDESACVAEEPKASKDAGVVSDGDGDCPPPAVVGYSEVPPTVTHVTHPECVVGGVPPTPPMQRHSFDASGGCRGGVPPPPSPYWGHLDQIALAVTMGSEASFAMDCGSSVCSEYIPRGPETPSGGGWQQHQQGSVCGTPKWTPRKFSSSRRGSSRNAKKGNKDRGGGGVHGHKQAPFNIHPAVVAHPHYRPAVSHGCGGTARQPPSPATQFLMSPQESSEAAAFYTAASFSHHHHNLTAVSSPTPEQHVQESPQQEVSLTRKMSVVDSCELSPIAAVADDCDSVEDATAGAKKGIDGITE